MDVKMTLRANWVVTDILGELRVRSIDASRHFGQFGVTFKKKKNLLTSI